MTTIAAWRLRVDDGIAELAFSHPPRHAITHADVAELEERLRALADAGVGCVILTGSSPDVFVAHADLAEIVAMAEGRPTSADPGAWPRMLRLLDRGLFVTIAAVEGRAWGGGFEIALSCTLRVASGSASFCFPEARIGIVPAVAAHRLLAMVPEGVAAELLLLARPIDADRAFALGLVNSVVPAGTAAAEARKWGRRILESPPGAVAAVRDLLAGARNDEGPRRRRQQELFAERLADPSTGPLLEAARRRFDAGEAPGAVFESGRESA